MAPNEWSCKSCGTWVMLKPGESPPAPGNCPYCRQLLSKDGLIGELTRYGPMADRGQLKLFYLNDPRPRIAAAFVTLKRPMDGLNFCLASLDVTSNACSSHPEFNPVFALAGLKTYKREDLLDLTTPTARTALLNIQHHPNFELLYTLSLTVYIIYGPTHPFTLHSFRLAHSANQYAYKCLAYGRGNWRPPAIPGDDRKSSFEKYQLQNAGIYSLRFEEIWSSSGGSDVLKWMRDNEKEVEKKMCDARGCGKVEGKKGEWKMCTGCFETWYCGEDCQKRDWKEGAHKSACKQARWRLDMTYLGMDMWESMKNDPETDPEELNALREHFEKLRYKKSVDELRLDDHLFESSSEYRSKVHGQFTTRQVVGAVVLVLGLLYLRVYCPTVFDALASLGEGMGR